LAHLYTSVTHYGTRCPVSGGHQQDIDTGDPHRRATRSSKRLLHLAVPTLRHTTHTGDIDTGHARGTLPCTECHSNTKAPPSLPTLPTLGVSVYTCDTMIDVDDREAQLMRRGCAAARPAHNGTNKSYACACRRRSRVVRCTPPSDHWTWSATGQEGLRTRMGRESSGSHSLALQARMCSRPLSTAPLITMPWHAVLRTRG